MLYTYLCNWEYFGIYYHSCSSWLWFMLCTAQLGGPVLKASIRVQYTPLMARWYVPHDHRPAHMNACHFGDKQAIIKCNMSLPNGETLYFHWNWSMSLQLMFFNKMLVDILHGGTCPDRTCIVVFNHNVMTWEGFGYYWSFANRNHMSPPRYAEHWLFLGCLTRLLEK